MRIAASAFTLDRLPAVAVCAAALTACASVPNDPGPITRHAPGARPTVDYSGAPLQCVPYARQASGISIYGDAHTWWAQAKAKYETEDAPERGAVMVLKGRNDDDLRGHVAVVRKLLNDRQITVDHANWANKGEIQTDTPVLDVSSSNDWSRVRVWNIGGGHFGGQVYSVQGFIRPERRTSGGFLW